MAKKRVHELAKQYNMPTAEVMKRLNAAGIAVKATASAVDEVAADAALTGKKQPATANGAKPKQPQRPQLRPPGDLGIRDLGARPPEGMKPKPKAKPEPKPSSKDERSLGDHAKDIGVGFAKDLFTTADGRRTLRTVFGTLLGKKR